MDRWVHILAAFGEKNKQNLSSSKRETDHPGYYQWKVKKPLTVMIWGCISNKMCEYLVDGKLPLMQRWKKERRVLLSSRCLFLENWWLFWNGVCFTCLPRALICLLSKMHDASWRGESNNNHHRLLSRWKSCLCHNIFFSVTLNSIILFYMSDDLPFHMSHCIVYWACRWSCECLSE